METQCNCTCKTHKPAATESPALDKVKESARLNQELFGLNMKLRESAPDSQQEWELEKKIQEVKLKIKELAG